MKLLELFEGVTADKQEVYHWTSAEDLRKIMRDNVIQTGASTHRLFGKTLRGVSLSRNPFFDIQDTYAIAGIKAWRIGLNLQRLRHDYKIIPIRDERYRNRPRGSSTQEIVHSRAGPVHDYRTGEYRTRRTFSDETEEFCIGDIYPFWHYCTSIAIEARHIEPHFLPDDAEDDYEPFSNIMSATKSDTELLHEIMAGTIYGPKVYEKNWLIDAPDEPIRLPVPFNVVLRNPYQTEPFAKFYADQLEIPEKPENDNVPIANGGTETRGERSRHYGHGRGVAFKTKPSSGFDHVLGGDPNKPLAGELDGFAV